MIRSIALLGVAVTAVAKYIECSGKMSEKEAEIRRLEEEKNSLKGKLSNSFKKLNEIKEDYIDADFYEVKDIIVDKIKLLDFKKNKLLK